MIVARALTKIRDGKKALDGLELEVDGHVLVVVGPSGSGKSTLLRCLGGFERFDSGSLSVLGHDLARVDTTVLRRDVGFVFQGYHLFPHLTALQNMQLAPTVVSREPRAESEPRARALLAKLGLEAKADVRPAALSGGEQQRIAIARALMMRPKVLLFDEPTSALDPIRAAEMGETMRALASDDVRVVVVTHSMILARALGGTLAVLDAGRLVECGPSAALLEAPQHEISRRFFAR